MSLEQYIVRELKQDIKYLIKRVTELEGLIRDIKQSQQGPTESQRMQDELEPIDDGGHIESLKDRIKDLTNINEEHQKLNGQLRRELAGAIEKKYQ